ncbi:MAG: HD-GYP domain-containing protein [Gammaproteobacteria bacterium]|nr:HD-GYP domain-containing protein [Gammaproteobacteria bacterium]
MDNKVRVYTADLKIGMYVSELDRPWVETSFMFQGFAIQNDEDIRELQSCCDVVYVDKELSRPEAAQHLATTHVSKVKVENHSIKPHKPGSFREADFRHNLVRSHRIYKDARGWVDTMLEDSRLGNSIDTEKARSLVAQLADQVIQSPDALVWLTHLKSRDEYTATHCINVCILALTFGRCMGLEDKELHQLGMGALLHDIGKMRVPDEILNKPGKLTKEEFRVMMEHPSKGNAMLREDHELDPASMHIVLHHHERLDGSGYPHGLGSEEIPVLTRISSIVDVYDAITSDRCYHDGIAPADAMDNLFKWSEGNFDVSLLERFIKCMGIFPIGSAVRLNTGDIGMIVATDAGHRLKPIVLLIMGAKGELYQPKRLINLSSSAWKESGTRLSIEDVLEPGSFGIDIRTILEDELQLSVDQVSRYKP